MAPVARTQSENYQHAGAYTVLGDLGVMNGTTATGRVSWFNVEKQFGFVKLDDRLGDAPANYRLVTHGLNGSGRAAGGSATRLMKRPTGPSPFSTLASRPGRLELMSAMGRKGRLHRSAARGA